MTEAADLRREANRLQRQQTKERGTLPWEFEGRSYRVTGPYEATEEHEARAAMILHLRRRAATLEADDH